uniref:Uncharacterized protein n=1 Tax=Heterorhabditis bacteriophora TaxID=37862 RepID=A0A1I7WII0_HETBA
MQHNYRRVIIIVICNKMIGNFNKLQFL